MELFTLSGQRDVVFVFSLLNTLSLAVLTFGFAISTVIFIRVSRTSKQDSLNVDPAMSRQVTGV